MARAYDQSIGLEGVVATSIEQPQDNDRAETRIKIVWGKRKREGLSVHAQSLDESSVAQSLDGNRLSGEPAYSPVGGT